MIETIVFICVVCAMIIGFVWCLCYTASRADDIAEQAYWKEKDNERSSK